MRKRKVPFTTMASIFYAKKGAFNVGRGVSDRGGCSFPQQKASDWQCLTRRRASLTEMSHLSYCANSMEESASGI